MAPSAAIERRILEREDTRIEVLAQGHGPLVVLRPSLGRGSDDFEDLARRLAAAGYRALMPSPRGIGATIGPLTGITLHDFARDVAAVIEAERCGPAVVVGHAFGNWVARTTAADRPDLVRAVVLLAAGHKGFAQAVRDSLTKCFDLAAPREERITALKHAFFAPGHDPTAWLEGWYPELALAERAAAAATPVEQWWSAGTAPILDVQAREDAFAPHAGSGKLRAELGERVTIAVIPDAGHALLPEQPEAVADAVIGYLRRL
jgi:pimeloyl-ACP methyl ester carboxylesterase